MIRRYLDERMSSLAWRCIPWPWPRPLVVKCLLSLSYLALGAALWKSGRNPQKMPLNSPETARSNLEKIQKKTLMSFATNKSFAASSLDISVIIPAYNVEQYLARCLDSAIEQRALASFYEIIVVNDGSTDGTAEILAKYAGLAPIKVIHQENRGASVARNTGLDVAVGKYIFFLDADDFLAPDSLAALLDKALQADADIVDGSWNYISGNLTRPEILPDRVLELFGQYPFWHNGYPCGKLMRRSLWKRARFPEGVQLYEDSILPYLIHAQCQKYASVSVVALNYCDNPTSLTHAQPCHPHRLAALWMFDQLFDFIAKDDEFAFNGQLTDWAIAHLSALMIHAAGHFGDAILQDVFVVAREILNRHGLLIEKPGRWYLNKIVLACRDGDFAAWKTLGMYF
ncbi:MAG: glycosyltransferase [Desulfobulbaceae bacterium]|jgi:glycosyltransferase involved in cell wall biosynthesis|nr:glycosyltransferase [Desulfobulbaceae bacterium]